MDNTSWALILGGLGVVIAIASLLRDYFGFKFTWATSREETLGNKEVLGIARQLVPIVFVVAVLLSMVLFASSSQDQNSLIVQQSKTIQAQGTEIASFVGTEAAYIRTQATLTNINAALEAKVRANATANASMLATQTAQANVIPLQQGTNVGRWEIILSSYEERPDEGDWKIVRIPIRVVNQTETFASATIPVIETRLITVAAKQNGVMPNDNMSFSYPVRLMESTGSAPITRTVIDYTTGGPVPPKFVLAGIYENDAVSSYYFEARIPASAVPTGIRIPGYLGDIELGKAQTPTPSVPTNPVPNLQRTVQIPGKANLSVVNIVRLPQSQDNHDRLAVTITVTSTNSNNDSVLMLRASAIGDELILGSPLIESTRGCSSLTFAIRSSERITRTICAMLPYKSRNIRIILTGDVMEYYETEF